ncbi:MAG: hypothetical protein FJY29_00890 [Betaproteobacteria bacterium]|nr:hypothetical protein [Betaproteobacteria bacterium]
MLDFFGVSKDSCCLRKIKLLRALLIILFAGWGCTAFAAERMSHQPVRPAHYTIEVQSTRSDDKPRMVSTWAHVFFEGEHYRALMPENIVRGSAVEVDFRWAPGSSIAGEFEKVELEVKGAFEDSWKSHLLGEGFREPRNGHLILSPAKLNFGPNDAGRFELRFLMRDAAGRTVQDGGVGSTLRFQLAAPESSSVLKFTEAWTVAQQGGLIAGKSFELEYAIERIEQQLSSGSGRARSPWCLFAKVQFDEGAVQSYPLLASHFEHPEKVIGLMPTVQIPEQARRMTIWFSAFHNTQTFFDSNFGQNYHFLILPR